MSKLVYTEEHEWLRADNGIVVVGITDYAQEQLGDIVYVELPEPGAAVTAGEQLAVIESVKAVGEITLTVTGTVAAINTRLADEPELVNSDPLGDGWLMQLSDVDTSTLAGFMDEEAYSAYVAQL